MNNISYSTWSTKWALIFFGISFGLALVVSAITIFIFDLNANISLGITGATFLGSFFLELYLYDKRQQEKSVSHE